MQRKEEKFMVDVTGLVDKINAWVPIIVVVGGAILGVVLSFIGLQWASSEDPQDEKQAKKRLLNVLKGGGIMLSGPTIWLIIQKTFGG